jgi:hypothetical protein
MYENNRTQRGVIKDKLSPFHRAPPVAKDIFKEMDQEFITVVNHWNQCIIEPQQT